MPSNSGTPLHVDINYTRRQRIGEWLVYGTRAAIPRPVLVSYNLFALQAESVSYDEKNRTVQAHGNVVFEDQFGRKQAESAAFKIENGNAIRTQ